MEYNHQYNVVFQHYFCYEAGEEDCKTYNANEIMDAIYNRGKCLG